MDTKPCGGKGRGRGRGKERSPASLVQLTLEEKVVDCYLKSYKKCVMQLSVYFMNT